MRRERLNEILAIILFVVTILMFLSLISYSPQDLSFNSYPANEKIRNYVGKIGAYFAFFVLFSLGKGAFLIPLITGLWAISRYWGKISQNLYLKFFSTLILLISFSSFLSLVFNESSQTKFSWGGLVGLTTASFSTKYFGHIGSYFILLTLFVLSVLVATEFLIIPPILHVFKLVFRLCGKKVFSKEEKPLKVEGRQEISLPEKSSDIQTESKIKEEEFISTKPSLDSQPKPRIKTYKPLPAAKKSKPLTESRVRGDFTFPPLDLLDLPPPLEQRKIQEDFQTNAKVLEGTLRDFGIETKVVSVHQGPVITRYELQPAAGIKIHRIVNLSDDIALAMKAHSVRVVAPIPGKDRVGVEVPNSQSTLVYLRELLESSNYQESESKLTLALGKDIAGEPIVTDLNNMPHLLIAGTTGSGKTVCVNALVISMLYKASPDEIKFVMVDPKMVELASFNGLPHLLCPVVTEAKKVSGALNWVVSEMERRYRTFAKLGVRNIELYNNKFSKETNQVMPYLVVIIDELADLMAIASQDIENAITRLAQLSRAVGIHIILATQRPSVDVITGVIKANFPARISFKVASKVDSRTVLDMNGADKLLGKGDMLFLRPGEAKPIRAQGSLVSDSEIEKVVTFLKRQREPQYNEEILREQEKKFTAPTLEKDEMFDEAVRLVLETGQASVSMLQRRLRLGYTRAARLIDAMEAEGIIGPFRGSKPREILIDTYEEQKPESRNQKSANE
jgi:S-DNA-T family DNA segregation ATPase FtsK/SpoIIIE